jgi:hypothetical protein
MLQIEPPNEDFKRKARKQILLPNPAWIGILTMPQGKDRLGGIQMPEKTLPLVA